jgi:hypothetical protein
MTEGRDRDLVQRAEQALSTMSLREPDWDGLTSRIEGAVGSPPPEDILLFAAPLPKTRDEGDLSPPVIVRDDDALPKGDLATAASDAGPTISIAPGGSTEVDEGWSDAPAASAAPGAAALAEAEEIEAQSEPAAAEEAPKSPREGVSLADLARATVARRRSSEAASIAKESLAVASQSRAQGVEEAAQRMLAATPASEKTAPRATPSIAEKRAAVARGNDLRGAWIGVAIAGIGLAAAFALVLSRPEAPAPLTVAEPAKVETQAPRTPTTIAPSPAPAPVAPTPAPEAALDPSSLPTLPREPAAAAQTTAGGAAKSEPLAAAPAPAPTPVGVASGKIVAEKIVLDEDPKAAPKTAPAPSAPKPGDAKLRPAELSGSTMTDRPSAGAAQAAVGAVLGNARACVSGHPQPSTAQLVFGSDGQVQSVSVGGPAAGTPAAGCIEAALKKARVQPFAASSFSLGVTVRPP